MFGVSTLGRDFQKIPSVKFGSITRQVLQVTNHRNIGFEAGLGVHRVETIGRVEDISNVQMLDTHESGQTAMLIMDEWNEQYLMVNTTNSRTSCTLRF